MTAADEPLYSVLFIYFMTLRVCFLQKSEKQFCVYI